MIANNLTRFLDAKKVAYVAFEIPAEKLSALEVAEILNVPPETVFKTIVTKREKPGKPILAIVPGSLEVDLKKLAAAVNEKKVFIPSMREAEEMTGLQAGGISALALINKGFQVVIDASAQTLDAVMVSAGQRGLQVRLAPSDLAKLVNGRFADIASKAEIFNHR
jgi:Cys-tRNA(Pro)/Cys-tRNA(Cys) deacylase